MCFKCGLKEEDRNASIGIGNEYINFVYLLKSTVIIVAKNCTCYKNKDEQDLDNTKSYQTTNWSELSTCVKKYVSRQTTKLLAIKETLPAVFMYFLPVIADFLDRAINLEWTTPIAIEYTSCGEIKRYYSET